MVSSRCSLGRFIITLNFADQRSIVKQGWIKVVHAQPGGVCARLRGCHSVIVDLASLSSVDLRRINAAPFDFRADSHGLAASDKELSSKIRVPLPGNPKSILVIFISNESENKAAELEAHGDEEAEENRDGVEYFEVLVFVLKICREHVD